MATALDFAMRNISAQAIKDAGHSAVLAYVSKSRPGANHGAKPLTKTYAQQLISAGLDIVSIYQYGKPGDATPSDWTTGYEGGRDHANRALQQHKLAGGPDHAPIFFAVDENISLDQWNTLGVHFFLGINDVLGVQRTGIYGHSRVCDWAREDNVIGHSTTLGKRWAWQTRAWSNGVEYSKAVLFQRVIDTPTNPGPVVDGSHVDVNDIWANDYGQWSLDRSKVAKAPEHQIISRVGGSHSSRNGTRVINGFLHTQEGNSSAVNLAAYLNNSANGVSYHWTLRDRILVEVVPPDRSSWSVLDANPYSVNICFAGSFASWSRSQWLEREADIEIAAYVLFTAARDLGFSIEVRKPPYVRGPGLSDHKYVTQALGIGTHTDVGPNFPWDVFESYVHGFASGTVAPKPPTAIEAVREDNPWLGDAQTLEQDAVRGGKFVEYQNGHIYWHKDTGAHPIPRELFDKFTELRWEQGPLGFPVNEPTPLTGGLVQGFQGGALYLKSGAAKALWVHGAIRDRWLRESAEKGPLGYPESDEIEFDNGAYQDYEHGRIYWIPNNTLAFVTRDGIDIPLSDLDD